MQSWIVWLLRMFVHFRSLESKAAKLQSELDHCLVKLEAEKRWLSLAVKSNEVRGRFEMPTSITIERDVSSESGCNWTVRTGDLYTDHLTFDEMIGLVCSLTVIDRRSLTWLKTKEEHDRYRDILHKITSQEDQEAEDDESNESVSSAKSTVDMDTVDEAV